jgi:uncharacterized protein YciU (UPF0263 family)
MTKFVHIVQVHPVYDGILQTHKVREEKEFGTKVEADDWIEYVNLKYKDDNLKAVYLGCVNDETGELV